MSEDYEALARKLEELVAEAAKPWSIATGRAKRDAEYRLNYTYGFHAGDNGDYPLVPFVVAALRCLRSCREDYASMYGSEYPDAAAIDRVLALARSLEEGT